MAIRTGTSSGPSGRPDVEACPADDDFGFSVGAAVLTDTGQIHAGCNVENASYGLTICAERSAVCQAVAAGNHRITAIAVAAANGVTPCGACRQVLAEFADDMPVLLVDPERPTATVQVTLDALLPQRFQRRDREPPPAIR